MGSIRTTTLAAWLAAVSRSPRWMRDLCKPLVLRVRAELHEQDMAARKRLSREMGVNARSSEEFTCN